MQMANAKDERRVSRKAWVLCILAIIVLRLPALTWGFGFDDYAHQIILAEEFEHDTLTPWSLFDFGGTPQEGEPGYEEGAFPFWADTDMSARFLRPVTSASLMLDHKLFGRDAAGYHPTQIAGFALLLVLLARLYLALGLSQGMALLATCMFGLEDGSTIVVGWIANRSTLLAALGLVLGLLFLNRGLASRERRPAALALAILCGLFAVGAKESGAGVLAIFASAALAGLVPGWRASGSRARTVGVICAALGAAYICGYFALGYGTHSAFYPTPWTNPSGFLSYLALHLTSGVATCAGPIVTDVGFLHEHLRPAIIVSGLGLLLVLARPVARSVRQLEAGRLFLAIGVLTMLPQTMAAPSDRLAFLPMVGWAPLLACAVLRGWRSSVALARFGSRALATLTLILSPLYILLISNALGMQLNLSRQAMVEAEVQGDAALRREVFVLQAPFATMMLSVGPLYAIETGERDVRIWPLQNGRRGLRLTRTSARSFRFETTDASFLTLPFEYVYRVRQAPPEVGHVYKTSLFHVRVEAVDERGARSFELSLAPEVPGDLTGEQYSFLHWDGERLRHTPLPAVGETADLATAPEPFPMAP